jgi:hypothetical protein
MDMNMGARTRRKVIKKAAGKIEKQLGKQRYDCLYPNCQSTAIRSHSQQKEGQLRAISEKGIVYVLKPNPYQLIRNKTNKFNLKEVGIKEASTFAGYCALHDGQLFKDIEIKPLQEGDNRQAALLFLRAISYEIARKQRGATFQALVLKEIQSVLALDVIEHGAGIDWFLKRDAPFYLNLAVGFAENDSLGKLTTVWKVVPRNILISCTCCLSPYLDEHESKFDATGTEIQPVVTFSAIPNSDSTHIVISWLKQDHEAAEWIIEAAESNLEALIDRFAFAESEDTCVNPKLWESLPEPTRSEILHAMRLTYHRGSLEEAPKVVRLNKKE